MSEGFAGSPRWSLPFAALLLALFAAALVQAVLWPLDVSLMPLTVSAVGLLAVALALAVDWRKLRHETGAGDATPDRSAMRREAVLFFVGLVALLGASLVIGQQIAIPLFIVLFAFYKARIGFLASLAYGLGGYLLLYLMFDRFMPVLWYPSLLFG